MLIIILLAKKLISYNLIFTDILDYFHHIKINIFSLYKMLFIISLFLIVASEWVGNITLSPSMKTYSSIRLVTSLPNWPLVLNLPICQLINLTTNCTDKAIIISETTNIIETLESSTPSIVIIIRNNHRTIISDALIFEISEKNTEGLLNTTDSSLQILFDYNCNP
jgi:hypothetical protein